MKKLLSLFTYSAVALTLSAFLVTNIYAATTGVVSATVTAQEIAITVSDGAIAYGTMAIGGTADTTNTGVDDSQTASNTGNITEDFNIQGSNSAAWTLAGTAGSETYTHEFCITDCDGTPTWTPLTTSYQTLASAITTGTPDQIFDLELNAPVSTATFTEQSVDITVQAVAN